MSSSLATTTTAATFIETQTVIENKKALETALGVARCVLVYGPVGCGKTALVNHLSESKDVVLSKVTLDDTSDAKDLIGGYTCTDIPGETVWAAGPLIHAVKDGHWLLLEDIDLVSFDIMTTLAQLGDDTKSFYVADTCERYSLHPGFKVIATTTMDPLVAVGGSTAGGCGSGAALKRRGGAGGAKDIDVVPWAYVSCDSPTEEEVYIIAQSLHKTKLSTSMLKDLILTPIFAAAPLVQKCSPHSVSLRDILKVCSRVATTPTLPSLDRQAKFVHSGLRHNILCEMCDVMVAHIAAPAGREQVATALCIASNMPQSKAESLLVTGKPDVLYNNDVAAIGRVSLPLGAAKTSTNNAEKPTAPPRFAQSSHTLRLLERLAACVKNNEPVLLTGETGIGKTYAVQLLSRMCCSGELVVVNMSHSTEHSEFIGGWKPKDSAKLVSGLHDDFQHLFRSTFNAEKNIKFLASLQKVYEDIVKHPNAIETRRNFLKVMEKGCMQGVTKAGKAEADNLASWSKLRHTIDVLMRQVERGAPALVFEHQEGVLFQTQQRGDWLLLDEINLANTEVLDRIAATLELKSSHADFRLFACMNPPTDAGKKSLPLSLRSRFTELYVEEPSTNEDLAAMVEFFLKGIVAAPPVQGIVSFFREIRDAGTCKLFDSDSTAERPHYSIRTLCRALDYAMKHVGTYGFERALVDGICMTFATQLAFPFDLQVEDMIYKHVFPTLRVRQKRITPKPPTTGGGASDVDKAKETYVEVKNFWLHKGPNKPYQMDGFVETKSVERHMINLARCVLAKKAVLLQGPTSTGKTSVIEYFAYLTGHEFIRINNHRGTELQEYMGQYIQQSDGGLTFVDGPLVTAVRTGAWIVLDELNLASSEVLEALNRLLDDNHELVVPETREVITPHPNFRLFATQNPSNVKSYGGRSILSRAFRNRFLELHVGDIPKEDLIVMLGHPRFALPPSHVEIMIAIMETLQRMRSESNVFAGKYGYLTPRDLFRWAGRQIRDKQQLAYHGMVLFGDRCRRPDEREIVRDVIKKHCGKLTDLSDDALYDIANWPALAQYKDKLDDLPIVMTRAMRRLFLLTGLSMVYNEPMLACGETGGGKTTVCEVWAKLLGRHMYIINCHQHSETSDFIGSLIPVHNEPGKLFGWKDGPITTAMREGFIVLIDEISLAEDNVLERLNSVLDHSRSLTLPEKGGIEGMTAIKAHPEFRIMATMNPGGDFGKKELSDALRNRFTEVYVPGIQHDEDVLEIVRSKLKNTTDQEVIDEVVGAVKNRSAAHSIRDVVTLVEFVVAAAKVMTPTKAVQEGSYLMKFLSQGVEQTESCIWDVLTDAQPPEIHGAVTNYLFSTPTTRRNLSRIVRAMILEKRAILLEGPPGVGKTSLVEMLGYSLTGKRVVRINLGEQSDMMDLVGTHIPATEGFKWCDGILLAAVKAGSWVILDELNLAPQPVLEGLNSLLDHRRSLFLPENSEFVPAAEGFRIFACQNPMTDGGGRKGLPKSFLNRFTHIHMLPLEIEDMRLIMAHLQLQSDNPLPDDVQEVMVKSMSKFVEKTSNHKTRDMGYVGNPWDFNFRDLGRWCALSWRQANVPEATQLAPELHFAHFVDAVLAQRFRTPEDRDIARDVFRSIVCECLGEDKARQAHEIAQNVSLPALWQVHPNGGVLANQSLLSVPLSEPCVNSDIHSTSSLLLPCQDAAVRTVMLTAQHNVTPVILCGPSGSGKSTILQMAADLMGKELHTISLVASCDTVDLLGGFRQDPGEAAKFQWHDSALVAAVEFGHWIVLDNANFCPPTVLDRLNPLLEVGGKLVLNEQGLVDGATRVIVPHPEFRLFISQNPRFGELSRAMRNRSVEIYVPEWEGRSLDLALMLCGAGAPLHVCQAIQALPLDAQGIRNVLRVARAYAQTKDVEAVCRVIDLLYVRGRQETSAFVTEAREVMETLRKNSVLGDDEIRFGYLSASEFVSLHRPVGGDVTAWNRRRIRLSACLAAPEANTSAGTLLFLLHSFYDMPFLDDLRAEEVQRILNIPVDQHPILATLLQRQTRPRALKAFWTLSQCTPCGDLREVGTTLTPDRIDRLGRLASVFHEVRRLALVEHRLNEETLRRADVFLNAHLNEDTEGTSVQTLMYWLLLVSGVCRDVQTSAEDLPIPFLTFTTYLYDSLSVRPPKPGMPKTKPKFFAIEGIRAPSTANPSVRADEADLSRIEGLNVLSDIATQYVALRTPSLTAHYLVEALTRLSCFRTGEVYNGALSLLHANTWVRNLLDKGNVNAPAELSSFVQFLSQFKAVDFISMLHRVAVGIAQATFQAPDEQLLALAARPSLGTALLLFFLAGRERCILLRPRSAIDPSTKHAAHVARYSKAVDQWRRTQGSIEDFARYCRGIESHGLRCHVNDTISHYERKVASHKAKHVPRPEANGVKFFSLYRTITNCLDTVVQLDRVQHAVDALEAFAAVKEQNQEDAQERKHKRPKRVKGVQQENDNTDGNATTLNAQRSVVTSMTSAVTNTCRTLESTEFVGYEDVTAPFSTALRLMLHPMATWSSIQEESEFDKLFTRVLVDLAAYPRAPVTAPLARKLQGLVAHLAQQSSRKSIRSALHVIDVLLFRSVHHWRCGRTYHTQEFFGLLDLLGLLWKDMEAEEARRAKEANEKVKYYGANVTVIEGDDEKAARVLQEMFPSYYADFMAKDPDQEVDDEAAENAQAALHRATADGVRSHAALMLHVVTAYTDMMDCISRHSMMNTNKFHIIKPSYSTSTVPATTATARSSESLPASQERSLRVAIDWMALNTSCRVNDGAEASRCLSGVLRYALSLHDKCNAGVAVSQQQEEDEDVDDFMDKTFNIYLDCDGPEAIRALRSAVVPFREKLQVLLNEFPDNSVLHNLIRLVNILLALSVFTTPIMKFVAGFEVLLKAAFEWEQNAHSGVSIHENLTAISREVVRWRRRELHGWAALANAKRQEFDERSASWFCTLRAVLFADHTAENFFQDVFDTVQRFIISCKLGELRTILRLVRGLSMECAHGARDDLASLLMNIYHYYSQFLSNIEVTISLGFDSVNATLKDFIKVMSWHDATYYAVQASTQKSQAAVGRALNGYLVVLTKDASDIIAESEKKHLEEEKVTADMLPQTHMCSQPLATMSETMYGLTGDVLSACQRLTDPEISDTQKRRSLKQLFEGMETRALHKGVAKGGKTSAQVEWLTLFRATFPFVACELYPSEMSSANESLFYAAGLVQRARRTLRNPHSDLGETQCLRLVKIAESILQLCYSQRDVIVDLCRHSKEKKVAEMAVASQPVLPRATLEALAEAMCAVEDTLTQAAEYERRGWCPKTTEAAVATAAALKCVDDLLTLYDDSVPIAVLADFAGLVQVAVRSCMGLCSAIGDSNVVLPARAVYTALQPLVATLAQLSEALTSSSSPVPAKSGKKVSRAKKEATPSKRGREDAADSADTEELSAKFDNDTASLQDALHYVKVDVLGRLGSLASTEIIKSLESQIVLHDASARLCAAFARMTVVLLTKGLCKPEKQEDDQQQQDNDGEGLHEGTGMDDGKGEKDVTQELENEDQLMNQKDLEEQDEKEDEQRNKKDEEEEDQAAEVTTDFQAKKENMDEDDEDEAEENEEENEEMGSVDAENERIDKKQKSKKDKDKELRDTEEGEGASDIEEDEFDEEDGNEGEDGSGDDEDGEGDQDEAKPIGEKDDGDLDVGSDIEAMDFSGNEDEDDRERRNDDDRSSDSGEDTDREDKEDNDPDRDPAEGSDVDENQDPDDEKKEPENGEVQRDEDGDGEDEEEEDNDDPMAQNKDENDMFAADQQEEGGNEERKDNNQQDPELSVQGGEQQSGNDQHESGATGSSFAMQGGGDVKKRQDLDKNKPQKNVQDRQKAAGKTQSYQSMMKSKQLVSKEDVDKLQQEGNEPPSNPENADAHMIVEDEDDAKDKNPLLASAAVDSVKDVPLLEELDQEKPDDDAGRDDDEEDEDAADKDNEKRKADDDADNKDESNKTMRPAPKNSKVLDDDKNDDNDDDVIDAADLVDPTDPAQVWQAFHRECAPLSQLLCEHLRRLLEPTVIDRLKGDYKTGKRLNIKKLIPYIASNCRKDKIWLRRTMPSKRQYQIAIAVDDSYSMVVNGVSDVCLKSIALMTVALQLLEVGEISVLALGDGMQVCHPLDQPFDPATSGPAMFGALTFKQRHTKFRKFLEESLDYLDENRLRAASTSRSSTHGVVQLMFVLSDGQITEDRAEIRRLQTRAQENGQVIVLLILDQFGDKDGKITNRSVMDMESVEFTPDGKVVRKAYLDNFPFSFYTVVKDVAHLPDVLSDTVKQWFDATAHME